MAGTNKSGQWLPLRRNQGLIEGDSLVAWQHRLTNTNEPVPIADWGRDMSYLKSAWLSLFGGAAQLLEGFLKERFDIVRL